VSDDTTTNSAVTQTEPPRWQTPYLQQGLSMAQNLLNAGAPQQYPGQTVVPFSQQTEQANAGVQQRALAGSPTVAAANRYVQGQLGGAPTSGFGAGNPYLDRLFDQAAMRSQGRLESEFARSGRNINAAAPLRGQQLNDLATQIYGGAYDAEANRALQDVMQQRGLQGQALSAAIPLANQDYIDLAALRGVGSDVEGLAGRYQADAQNRFNYEQTAPDALLDRYIARVSGQNLGQTSTSTTSQPVNTGANALGGALAGAGLGGMLGLGNSGRWWSAGLGGLLGLL
jgi:hypothetical protein